MIPYGKQTINNDDIQSIIDVLKENKYLTTGPKVEEFETKMCQYTSMKYAIAVSNGTAALHCTTYAANLQPNDEVIVSTMSFIASANAILYCHAIPIFCDINPDTLNIDETKIESLITNKTKAIITVDFAGQLCNYQEINKIAKKYNLIIIEDASHSVGITQNNDADLVTYSFHPVKNMTTAEGGMILTNNEEFYKKIKQFRNHGIDMDYKNRYLHYYNMTELGYNYRLTDLQCVLGISQLTRLREWINIRQEIAEIYITQINNSKLKEYLEPLKIINKCAYHIFIVKIKNYDRDTLYKQLIEKKIGVNVHYKPIHLQPYYINNYQTYKGLCPISEEIYEQILTLPIYPTLGEKEIDYILNVLKNILLS